MSIYVLSWVFENSTAEGTDRLVLLALADFAHDDGTKAFPSIETLSRKARTKPRTTQYALRRLEEGGHISQTGTTKKGTRIYSVLFVGGADRAGVQPDAPNPSEVGVRTTEKTNASRATRAKLKVSGENVKPTLWVLTTQILDEFNRQTERAISALDQRGQPSEWAKRIYLRVLAWPELTFDQHRDIIERTLASKWWGDDAPHPGNVYGPRIFEENLTRKPTPKQTKDSKRKERAKKDREAIAELVAERQERE